MKLFMMLLLSAAVYGQSVVPEGAKALFNGKDFTGWNIKPDGSAWKIEDGGVLHCYGKPSEPYVILTDGEYENFELWLEFRMSHGCNSGVMVHQPDRGWGRESRVGMELQVSDDAGKEAGIHSCGAVYSVIPPLVNAVKPAGLWNSYHIIIDWPFLLIELNGQTIQNVNLDNYPQLKYRLRKGHIGLQNHGKEVEYRNIFIRELPSKEPAWKAFFNGKDLSGWEQVGNARWSVVNGELTATGGDGYLVSKDPIDAGCEVQIFTAKKGNRGVSGVYYGWQNETVKGYLSEFYDDSADVKLQYMEHNYYLTQIINYPTETTVFLNGIEIRKNTYRVNAQSGKIAIFHSATDPQLRIPVIRIKPLEPLNLKK